MKEEKTEVQTTSSTRNPRIPGTMDRVSLSFAGPSSRRWALAQRATALAEIFYESTSACLGLERSDRVADFRAKWDRVE